jgi:hypothetical protein
MSGETVPTSWRAWDFLVREAQKCARRVPEVARTLAAPRKTAMLEEYYKMESVLLVEPSLRWYFW